MILQTMGFFQVLADIIGAILLFLKPIVTPIGVWMVNWITATIEFLQQNLGDLTIFIVICVLLVVSGMIVNIIWPGDRPGSIFSKGIEKFDKLDERIDLKEEKDIVEQVRRCKDCGNPIGDAEVCPLCGAPN